jgi:hypothetical protein
MRSTTAALTAALAIGAGALLAGCSGGSNSSSPSIPGGVNQAQSRAFHASREYASGVAPKFLSRIKFGHSQIKRPSGPGTCPGGPPCGNVYVSDFGTGAVEALLNVAFTPNGGVSTGLNGPDGEWTDTKHNLYVGNFGGLNIVEYACVPGSAPSCGPSPLSVTYSSGLSDPIGVSTDNGASPNVYAADYLGDQVAEFPQQVNSQIAACPVGGGAESVAVDSSTGNVFVAYNNLSGFANIVEFAGGLSGCNGTILGATLSFAGGMVLDSNKNLVVTDQLGPTVDVIAPPYTSVSSTCGSGYSDPFHVSITKGGATLYVADVGNANVQVYNYPACTLRTTLSGGTLSDPAAASDTYNYNS